MQWWSRWGHSESIHWTYTTAWQYDCLHRDRSSNMPLSTWLVNYHSIKSPPTLPHYHSIKSPALPLPPLLAFTQQQIYVWQTYNKNPAESCFCLKKGHLYQYHLGLLFITPGMYVLAFNKKTWYTRETNKTIINISGSCYKLRFSWWHPVLWNPIKCETIKWQSCCGLWGPFHEWPNYSEKPNFEDTGHNHAEE